MIKLIFQISITKKFFGNFPWERRPRSDNDRLVNEYLILKGKGDHVTLGNNLRKSDTCLTKYQHSSSLNIRNDDKRTGS